MVCPRCAERRVCRTRELRNGERGRSVMVRAAAPAPGAGMIPGDLRTERDWRSPVVEAIVSKLDFELRALLEQEGSADAELPVVVRCPPDRLAETRRLIESCGGEVVRVIQAIGAVAANLRPQGAQRVARSEYVTAIHLDRPVSIA